MSMQQRSAAIWVVETVHGKAYLGQVEVKSSPDHSTELVKVYSGYRGHPPVIDGADIASMQLAARHPDVVVTQ